MENIFLTPNVPLGLLAVHLFYSPVPEGHDLLPGTIALSPLEFPVDRLMYVGSFTLASLTQHNAFEVYPRCICFSFLYSAE